MLNFYGINQKQAEKVQQYAARLEKALNKIQVEYPDRIRVLDVEGQLKDRLFHGLRKSIKDTIRYHFAESGSSYNSVFRLAKEAEAEELNGPKVNVQVKSASGSVEVQCQSPKSPSLAKLDEIQERVSVLLNAVQGSVDKFRDNQNQNGNNNRNNGGGKGDRRKVPMTRYNKDRVFNRDQVNGLDDNSRIPSGQGPQCWKCWGWGHRWADCPSQQAFVKPETTDLNPNRGEGRQRELPPSQPQQQQQQPPSSKVQQSQPTTNIQLRIPIQ